jgi:hypothetical protein
MSSFDKEEIPVVTYGDEGRFLQWQPPVWKAFDHYNYRHTFEESPLTRYDFEVLRRQFGLDEDSPPNADLVRMSPDELMALTSRPRH